MIASFFSGARRVAFAVSLLGIVLVAGEARATDAPHDATRLPNQCSDCHILHNAPGMALTNVAGNFNLCNSCHVANGRPTWAVGDQAIPGTSGSSHGWSQNEINATYGASEPTNNDLIEHSDGFTSNNPNKKVKCSTCHDPHQQAAAPFDPAAPASPTAAGRHFMRVNNTANQLCLDCHTTRNLIDAGHGSWTGANLSHPVRVSNPATADFFNPPREAGGAAQLAVNVGTATGGTTTTLTDSTKAWAVNGLVGQWIRFTSGSNRNLTRAITANTATQATFAAVGTAVAAGVTYEIDADGNLTNNVVLDNGGTPSFTAGTVQCLSCHGVHNADSNASTYDDQPRPGDGMLLRRANDDTVCTGCHTVQLHNSTTTGSSRPAWGASFTCKTCHRPHRTPNIHLVNQSIATPNSGVKAVDFRRMTTGVENQGLVNQADPGTGPCEVCHTDTRNGGALTTPGTATFTLNNVTVTGVGTTWASQLAAGWEIRCTQGGSSPGAWTRIVAVNSNTSLTLSGAGYKGASCAAGSSWQAANPRFRNSPSGRGAAGTEHYAGLCTTCHTHAGGFKGGESSGNTRCTTCHDFDMVIDDAARTTKYHHVMEVDDKLTAGITTYPTSATPTVATADEDKSCVQCHADHNVFRPDLNASNTAGRGANLRSRILNGPPTGNPPAPSAPGDAAAGYYTDRDFDNAYTSGGICLSCHTTAQTKNQTDQASDGTTVTPALAKATFTASAHAFNVAGRIATGPGPFNVACTKCHNDEQTKGYQDGTWKFSLHATNERRLLGSLGITAPTDPLEEKFCFRCHSAVTDVTPGGGPVKGVTLRDYYNATAMTARSEGIYAQFQKGSAGTPAGPYTTQSASVLHFKPAAEFAPSEPMPNAHETTDTLRTGSVWIGRAMSPNASTVAYETKSQVTARSGTTYWAMVSFTSPPVATAVNLAAANWTIALHSRSTNTAEVARVRYRVYVWTAADAIGTQIAARTTFGTTIGTAAAPGAVQTISFAGAAASLAAGDKIVVDLELQTAAGGSTSYTASYYFGSGAPSSLTLPAAVSFDLTAPAVAPYGRHGVGAYSGLHRPSTTDETLAYIAANKHVECADCHDPHGAGAGVHTQGTNLVSGALADVPGITATYSGTNWTAPTMAATLTTATKEHEICYKCHSSANTSLATWNAAWTNVALEFSTSNQSYHPVAGALPVADPGVNGSSRLTAAQLVGSATWTPGSTMYCSDCHGNDAATPAAQGPHGSAASFMLKGPNTGWPLNSGGVLATPSQRTGVFCNNCHPTALSSNSAHDRGMAGDDHDTPCISCHILVPHGGKMSRLIGDRQTMPTRYAYQGNLNNMFISAFTKTTPANYRKSNCQSAQSGCTTHGAGPTENW